MRDAEMWREKAAMLRESAAHQSDAPSKQVLLVLADDCEELAANVDATESAEKQHAAQSGRPTLSQRPR